MYPVSIPLYPDCILHMYPDVVKGQGVDTYVGLYSDLYFVEDELDLGIQLGGRVSEGIIVRQPPVPQPHHTLRFNIPFVHTSHFDCLTKV